MKNPDDETTLGGQLHQLGGKLEKAKHKIPGDLHLRVPHPLSNVRQKSGNQDMSTDDSTVTVVTTCDKFENDPDHPRTITPPLKAAPKEPPRYDLRYVLKIDNYSRRIFPVFYIVFLIYFFIRYMAIEGAFSFDLNEH